jgi:putative ABC transport system substrate-binding protein
MKPRATLLLTLALALLAAPVAAAPAPAKVPRIGFLGSGTPAAFAPLIAAFRQGLRDLGYVEGQTVVLELR